MEDRDLVMRTLSGDERAYRDLIRRYRNAVYALAISFVRDFDLAEDLAQEAFILGYYRLSTLTDGDRFGVWLRTITANLCRMELRRRRATPVDEAEVDAIPGPGPAPDEVHRRNEIQRRVLAALGELSEKDREAVILYYLDGRPVAEIGRFLGATAGAVKGRLHRARRHLRMEMMDMAETTLSQRKLGPEFAGRVELQRFSDLAELTDEELKKLMNEELDAGMGLVSALRSEDSGTKALMARILATLPRNEAERFKINVEYCDPVQHFQGELLSAARRLQRSGEIRPAPERACPKPEGSVMIEKYQDFTRLTDDEIQRVFRQVDTKDLAAALKSQEPGMDKVRVRCFANVSERVRKLMEAEQTYGEISEAETRAAQERILKIVHKIQEAGEIRAGKSG